MANGETFTFIVACNTADRELSSFVQETENRCREVEMPNTFAITGAKKVTGKCSSTSQQAPNSITINGNENKKCTSNQTFHIIDECLRKRIIQMLALKPYERSELLERLMKEGISEFEKKFYYPTLYSVGTLEGELVHLDAKIWNEVEYEWRFYSPEDAAIVKKRKEEACRIIARPLMDDIVAKSVPIQKKQSKTGAKEESPDLRFVQHGLMNSALKTCRSPAPESKKSNDQVISPPSSYKKHTKNRERKREEKKTSSLSISGKKSSIIKNNMKHVLKDSCMVEKIKKKRAQELFSPYTSSSSHFVSTSPPSHLSSASPPSHSASASLPSQSASASSPLQSTSASSPLQSASASPPLQSASASPPFHAAFDLSPLQSFPVSSSSHSASSSSNPTFASSFSDHDVINSRRKPKITSFEERQRYKELFDNLWACYLSLKGRMAKAEETIAALEDNVKNLSDGTQEYKAALKKLFEAYEVYYQGSQNDLNRTLMYFLRENFVSLRNLMDEFDAEHSKS